MVAKWGCVTGSSSSKPCMLLLCERNSKEHGPFYQPGQPIFLVFGKDPSFAHRIAPLVCLDMMPGSLFWFGLAGVGLLKGLLLVGSCWCWCWWPYPECHKSTSDRGQGSAQTPASSTACRTEIGECSSEGANPV